MYDISLFMAENQTPVEGVRYAATERLRDKDGKALEWEIVPVTSDENEALRKSCMLRSGKRGRQQSELNTELYMAKLAAACTAEPNLNNAALQDSYGVKCAEELLHKLLSLPGDYDNYTAKVVEVCGFAQQLEADVEAVKN